MTWSFRTNGNYIDFIHTDDTSLHEETLVKSLHNTSKSVEWAFPTDITRVNFTIDNYSLEGVLITEIDFDGATMNEQADFETGIEAMFPGLAGSGSPGGSSYLVYTALLTQSGTDAPVAIVLENTFGDEVQWTRPGGAGSYSATFVGLFQANKVVCFSQLDWGQQVSDEYISLLARVTDDICTLYVFDSSFAPQDGFGNMSIEIRVYP